MIVVKSCPYNKVCSEASKIYKHKKIRAKQVQLCTKVALALTLINNKQCFKDGNLVEFYILHTEVRTKLL